MPKAFSDTLRVSLKRFFWPPRERLPCWSSPNKSLLGSRWSGMRTTWPAQCSWVGIKIVWMLERLAPVSTSVFGIFLAKEFPQTCGMEVVQLPENWHR